MLFAGIVLYEPDFDFIHNTIDLLLKDVSKVILVDNSSVDNSDVFSAFGNKVFYLPNKSNAGIAKALNQIMSTASSFGADWVLTLDQDSEIPLNMASDLYASLADCTRNIGIICPIFIESNSGKICAESGYVDECITSGSLTSVEAWTQTSGFDEWMFIDLVDYEFCDQLHQADFSIYRTSKVAMKHSIGATSYSTLFGHEFKNMNHSAFRKFYQARNRPYLNYKRGVFSLSDTLIRMSESMIKICLFEKQKLSKCRAVVSGTFEGLIKVGELRNGTSKRSK